MEAYLIDWFALLARWLHLIAGVAWIGASLHFIWLDNSLQPPPADSDKAKQGVKGEVWSIHGGGIYHFSKYHLAPPSWPRSLHWSKWEAYTTWISGIFLLVAVYYLQAQTYLVGQGKWLQQPGAVIAASGLYLLAGLAVYELLLRSPLVRRQTLLVLLLSLFLIFQCWLAVQLFSDRAAFLFVGALMGTIMAGNVFLGIIPAQKQFVAAVQAGQAPDPEPAAFAKQRSTHNNYFTLPVLFCMISNHYPFLYGHSWNWVILAAIIAITAYARHFFNLRHRGQLKYSILVWATLAFLLLASLLAYDKFGASRSAQQPASITLDAGSAFTLIDTHCRVCHSAKPTQPGFLAPPAGILMDDHQRVLGARIQLISMLRTHYMPPGNITGLTEEERAQLVAWLEQQ